MTRRYVEVDESWFAFALVFPPLSRGSTEEAGTGMVAVAVSVAVAGTVDRMGADAFGHVRSLLLYALGTNGPNAGPKVDIIPDSEFEPDIRG
jgi:hypothetical protein